MVEAFFPTTALSFQQFGKISRKRNFQADIDSYEREQMSSINMNSSISSTMTGLYDRTFAMVFHMKNTLYAYGYRRFLAAAGTRKPERARINFRHDGQHLLADNQLEEQSRPML